MTTSQPCSTTPAQNQRDETELERAIWKAAALIEMLADAVLSLREESDRDDERKGCTLAGYDALCRSVTKELFDSYYGGAGPHERA